MTPPEDRERLRRPRLEQRLEVGSLSSLTVLTAGAGSGKTTLLEQAFDSRFSVWHTVTPADNSLSTLTRNIVRRLRLVVPQLSSEVIAAVEGARGPRASTDTTRPQAIAAALAEDLDAALDQDIVLVLDDLHELDPGDSADFVAALCRHGPSSLKIVTATRSTLPFPVSRLRMNGEVTELGADELRFTSEEIEEIVLRHHEEATQELTAQIETSTGGWPVAVALALQALRSGEKQLAGSIAEEGGLFDYLAEEVLGPEPSARTGLRQASALPWFTSDLLKDLGIETGEIFTPGSVYLNRAPDVPGAFVVSPLVAEYFDARDPLTDSERSDISTRTSQWYIRHHAHAEALWCLQRAGNHQMLAEFLTEHGDTIISNGKTREVTTAINSLDDQLLTTELEIMDAEARQLLGDWVGAMARYNRVVPPSGPIPPRIAWRLGFLQHMRGEVVEALETYERAQRDTGDIRGEAALLGWQASARWLRGERDSARDLANEALALARAARDDRSLATAHTVLAMVAALDGDRASNDMHYLQALEHAERSGDVVQTIRIRANRASAFLEEGEFTPALAEIQIALRMADMTGFELWRAMSLSNRAQVRVFQGRLEEAVADLTEARSSFRRIGSRLEAYPMAHLGDVYRLRGDTARARTAYQEAIRLAESQHDLQGLIPALSGLVRLIAPSDPDEATELAKRATEVDSVIGRVSALVAAGWAALHNDQPGMARELAGDAAAVARARRDMPGLGEALELMAEVDPEVAGESLAEAREIWSKLDAPVPLARVEVSEARLTGGRTGSARAAVAARTLRRYGAMGLARQAQQAADGMVESATNELAIKTLGGFDVVVSGQSTPRSAWQSKVAREVLWMLIANRGRPINREVLIDRLWPDDELSKASNRLSVALSTIRRVFDPTGSLESDHYIAADRDAVGLAVDRVVIDVEDFLASAAEGQELIRRGDTSEGIAHLHRAEARYVGEFLEEDPFAEWAISLREQARSEYLSVAALLASAAESEGDHDGAARRYLRMLEHDAFNEPAHIGLVRAMERSGRHGTARRLYGIYVSRMAELDVEPDPFPETNS